MRTLGGTRGTGPGAVLAVVLPYLQWFCPIYSGFALFAVVLPYSRVLVLFWPVSRVLVLFWPCFLGFWLSGPLLWLSGPVGGGPGPVVVVLAPVGGGPGLPGGAGPGLRSWRFARSVDSRS